MQVKCLDTTNLGIWVSLRAQLWPDHPANAHQADGENIIRTESFVSFIVFNEEGQGIGFADASIRNDYVNGCLHTPVAYLEGIFVIPSCRRQGVAKRLVKAIQLWAVEKRCIELASDAALENVISQEVHQALGFKKTETVVFFKQTLQTPAC